MSKERARRREAREAESAARRLRHERQQLRRQRRTQLLRRVLPRRPGRVGRAYRRSPGERAALAVGALAGVGMIWFLLTDRALQVALTILLMLTMAVLVVAEPGRRGQ